MHKCPQPMRDGPRGRNALTEGDPGMKPWDRKALLPGFGERLGVQKGRVNCAGEKFDTCWAVWILGGTELGGGNWVFGKVCGEPTLHFFCNAATVCI